MHDTISDWKRSPACKMLRHVGLRPTRNRVQIADLLFAGGDRHLTAEVLFAEARSLRYPPSLATVYNALRDFAARGLVREIALYGSRTWYDTKTGPHFHYYVEVEEQLLDVPEDVVRAFDIPAPPGMRVVGVDVVVRLAPLRASDVRDLRVSEGDQLAQ